MERLGGTDRVIIRIDRPRAADRVVVRQEGGQWVARHGAHVVGQHDSLATIHTIALVYSRTIEYRVRTETIGRNDFHLGMRRAIKRLAKMQKLTA